MSFFLGFADEIVKLAANPAVKPYMKSITTEVSGPGPFKSKTEEPAYNKTVGGTKMKVKPFTQSTQTVGQVAKSQGGV